MLGSWEEERIQFWGKEREEGVGKRIAVADLGMML